MIALTVFVVLCVLVITNRIAGRTYVGKVLLAFDYFVCVLWTRDFGITISSRCALYWKTGHPPLFWKWLHIGLNAMQAGHCEDALIHDRDRLKVAQQMLS